VPYIVNGVMTGPSILRFMGKYDMYGFIAAAYTDVND